MNSIVEKISKNLTLCTGLLFSISVFYDYLFLNSIGLSFSEVPTSIQDHARSALIWLPSAALLFTIFWIRFNIDVKVESVSNPEKTKSEKILSFVASLTYFAAALMLLIFAKSPAYVLMFCFMVSMYMMPLLLSLLGIKRTDSVVAKAAGITAILGLLIVASNAYDDGARMLRSTHKWSIDISTIDGNQVIFASGIRIFDKATIIAQVNGTVLVLGNDSIKAFEKQELINYEKTYSCKLLNIYCDR